MQEEYSHTFRGKNMGYLDWMPHRVGGGLKSILAANNLYRNNPNDGAKDILPDISWTELLRLNSLN